jgi:hypothetical protein
MSLDKYCLNDNESPNHNRHANDNGYANGNEHVNGSQNSCSAESKAGLGRKLSDSLSYKHKKGSSFSLQLLEYLGVLMRW